MSSEKLETALSPQALAERMKHQSHQHGEVMKAEQAAMYLEAANLIPGVKVEKVAWDDPRLNEKMRARGMSPDRIAEERAAQAAEGKVAVVVSAEGGAQMELYDTVKLLEQQGAQAVVEKQEAEEKAEEAEERGETALKGLGVKEPIPSQPEK